MGIEKPYRRTCRQFVEGSYFREDYLRHPKFAESPQHYIRAFLLLQKDLQEIFDYIEPADDNLKCYSFRIHELLFRACVEVEANCRAILKENAYPEKIDKCTMEDYKKIEQSHRPSSYIVKLPFWDGRENERRPFGSWSNNGPLTWYNAYNSIKHNRHVNFKEANFENMIDAMSGLVVLLSSQFLDQEYKYDDFIVRIVGDIEESKDGFEPAIGGYFRVKYPDDWPKEERYDFNWDEIKDEEDPFKNYFERNTSSSE